MGSEHFCESILDLLSQRCQKSHDVRMHAIEAVKSAATRFGTRRSGSSIVALSVSVAGQQVAGVAVSSTYCGELRQEIDRAVERVAIALCSRSLNSL